MKRKTRNLLKVFLVLVVCLSEISAQDFEPEPLEPWTTTTTESSTPSTETTTEITTEGPTTTDTTPTTTTETTPTTTESSTITTTESSTITTTETMPTTTTDSSTMTTTESTPVTTTETPIQTPITRPPTTHKPPTIPTPRPYPPTLWPTRPTSSTPSHRECYFKKQQGRMHLQWTCAGPRWVHTMECYQCCKSLNSVFFGCYNVPYSYCEYYG